MTENELLQSVIDLARWSKWLYFHDNDARRNRAGFPDLTLVNPRTGRLLFVELKSDRGRLRPEQTVWLEALRLRHEATVWRPADWHSGLIRRVLTEGMEAAA